MDRLDDTLGRPRGAHRPVDHPTGLRVHLPELLVAATTYCDDADVAEELVRRTVLAAHRMDLPLEGPALRRWLHATLYRLHRLRQAHQAATGAATPDPSRPVRTPEVASDPAPDATVAMRRLPGPMRAAVHLVDVERFSYDELAEILGVAPSTATSLLHEARRHLAGILPGAAGPVDPRTAESGDVRGT